VKFLIAGLGSIGRRHLRNLLALGEQDIVLYRTGLSTLPADELTGFRVETDLKAALRLKPDAVIVSNPTSLHLDVAIPAAETGCHLLLEKPVSHSLERTDELRSAVDRGGGQVLVGFQFRFHTTLQAAASVLAGGGIGRPIAAHAHWGEYLPAWHPWEDYRHSYAARDDLGGGVVRTLCHPIDYLGWLLGRPELLWARTERLGDLDLMVEDVAELFIRFPNGGVGIIHLDCLQQPASHHLEIVGTQGTMRWNNSDGALRIYRVQHGTWEAVLPPDDGDRNSMFVQEMRHFVDVARGVALPRCTLDDGLHTLRIVMEALSR
jgi:predicted dehydrogenase